MNKNSFKSQFLKNVLYRAILDDHTINREIKLFKLKELNIKILDDLYNFGNFPEVIKLSIKTYQTFLFGEIIDKKDNYLNFNECYEAIKLIEKVMFNGFNNYEETYYIGREE